MKFLKTSKHWFLLMIFISLLSTSCNMMRKGSRIVAERVDTPERTYNPSAVVLSDGYKIELVAKELTYPTAVTFDDKGKLYVIEAGYAYGPETEEPRLLRVENDGSLTTIHKENIGPWTGVTFHEGSFFIAQGAWGGEGGKILRIEKNGDSKIILDNLPARGDHYTGELAFGPDGYLYFGNGTATNSAIVGKDNWKLGWMKDDADRNFHDIPCADITLRGKNYTTENPLTVTPDDQATTGAFVPFGTATKEGQVVKGEIPCSGAVYKMLPDGTDLQLVAWGFRNPYGVAFSAQGELYITENGFDARGTRPVVNSLDHLWKVEQGQWFGWPDYSGGVLLSDERFVRRGEDNAALLLKEYPGTPPKPVALFGIHSSSNGLDFSKSANFGHRGNAFVAQFGDLSPMTGKPGSPVGFKIVRVDIESGEVTDFAANKNPGPASSFAGDGYERPVSVTFSPDGNSLYVVDFGKMVMSPIGPDPEQKSGAIWKITRK